MLEAVWAHEEAPLVRHLGCFRDADMGGGERVVRSIEHQTEHVQGMYKSRPAAVEASVAQQRPRDLLGDHERKRVFRGRQEERELCVPLLPAIYAALPDC